MIALFAQLVHAASVPRSARSFTLWPLADLGAPSVARQLAELNAGGGTTGGAAGTDDAGAAVSCASGVVGERSAGADVEAELLLSPPFVAFDACGEGCLGVFASDARFG